ncbi:MFS transporter [Polycladidibacter stylochi]|uniref:MFS transporter n=1 Tax=Polycladidibacter stylochi TaxID=1807766 RepID=UPI00082CB495|nr:MFS transporter [Pseudovibrio stylochi]
MNSQNQHAGWRAWLAVTALGIGSFAIVTAELAPIGLLSQISADVMRPTSQVGLIVTLYAWIAAGAAIASAVWLGGLPRRPILITLMCVLAISSCLSALAENYAWLMSARIVGAFAHGAFWAMIGTLGAQLVPARQVGLATSIIFGGVSVASVLGVPLSNYIGYYSGWRTAFMIIGILSVFVAIAVRITLPKVAGSGRIGSKSLLNVLANRRLQRIFWATLFTVTAHFMAFTYVEPFLSESASMPKEMIAPLLLVFGAAGIAANVLTGALIDNQLKAILTTSLAIAFGSLLLLAIWGNALGLFGVIIALILWGGAIAAILVGLQTWVLIEAGEEALQASAVYVALFNGAIGLGAAIGGGLLGSTGLTGLFIAAAIFVCFGLAAILVLREPALAQS